MSFNCVLDGDLNGPAIPLLGLQCSISSDDITAVSKKTVSQ